MVVNGAVTTMSDKTYYECLNRMNHAEGRTILEPGPAFALNIQPVYWGTPHED